MRADLRHWLLLKGSLIRSAFKKYHSDNQEEKQPWEGLEEGQAGDSPRVPGQCCCQSTGRDEEAKGEEEGRGHGQLGATLGLLAGAMVLSRPQGENAGRENQLRACIPVRPALWSACLLIL